MNRRLRLAAIAAVCTLLYALLVGLTVAVTVTFMRGEAGAALGTALALLITWRLFYIIAEVIDA